MSTLRVLIGLVVAIAACVLLWLTHMGPWSGPPELPPLRPLTEPSYKTTPIPETTTVPPAPGGYVDDSTTDVFIVGGN